MSRNAFAVVLVVAISVRSVALIALYDNLRADPDAYRELAANLLVHGTMGFDADPPARPEPTAYRAPLYPLLLALCMHLPSSHAMSIAILHGTLGLATVVLLVGWARRFLTPRAATLAGLWVACDPILLHHSGLVMSETLATFLATLALVSLDRVEHGRTPLRAAWAGASMSLAALCRPVFLVPLVVAGFVLLLRQSVANENTLARRASEGEPPETPATVARGAPSLARRASVKRSAPLPNGRIGLGAAYALTAVLVLSPWWVRNHHNGAAILATTHGGYTLRLANHPSFYTFLREAPWGAVWDGEPILMRDVKAAENQLREFGEENVGSIPFERQRDRKLYTMALQTIQEHPGQFCYACIMRVARLWQLSPHRVEPQEAPYRKFGRWAVGVWYSVLFVLAVVGFTRLRKEWLHSPWIWCVVFAVSFTLVQSVFWTNMRMRAPLIPALALFAAAGVFGQSTVTRLRSSIAASASPLTDHSSPP